MRRRRRILYAVMITIGIAIVVVGTILSSRISDETAGRERLLPTEEWGRKIRDPSTRVETALAAGREKDAVAEPMLRMYAWKSEDEEFRLACIWALGEIGHKDSVNELARIVKKAGLPVRPKELDTALEALAKIKGEGAAAALLWALEKEEPHVRAAAARALNTRSEPYIIKALARATGEREPSVVRLAALASLRGGRAASVSRTVRRALFAEDGAVREAAKAALDDLSSSESAPGRVADSAVDVSKRILAWKVFPGAKKLLGMVNMLGTVGDARAAPALERAMSTARFVPEVADAVARARRSIEKRAGCELPPMSVKPPVAGSDRADPADTGSTPPKPGTIGADGILTVVLAQALTSDSDKRADLTLELRRRAGAWEERVWGHARAFNRAEHEALLIEHVDGPGPSFKVRANIHGGAWSPGGAGEYEIVLETAGPAFSGTYTGRYNFKPVRGQARATFRRFSARSSRSAAVRAGEHPRLLFREHELQRLRADVDTVSGRKFVGALLKQLDRVPASAEEELENAVVHGLLCGLFDDAAHGSRAADLVMSTLARGGPGDVDALATRLRNTALAFDLAYGSFDEGERRHVAGRLARLADAVLPGHGLVGDFDGEPGDLKKAGRVTALGLCALAVWRERNSLVEPGEPDDDATHMDYAVSVTANSVYRVFDHVLCSDVRGRVDAGDIGALLLFGNAYEHTMARSLVPDAIRRKHGGATAAGAGPALFALFGEVLLSD